MTRRVMGWLLGFGICAAPGLGNVAQASGANLVNNDGFCGGGGVFPLNTNICDNVIFRYPSNVTLVYGPATLLNPISELASTNNAARVATGLARGFGPIFFAPMQWFQVPYPTISGTGPTGYPIGAGDGSINCTGMPEGDFPYGNCNFSAYEQRVVPAGTLYRLSVTADVWATQMVVPEVRRGINWLQGDLHATFQTSILDRDFRFLDALIAQSRGQAMAPIRTTSVRPAETIATGGARQDNFAVLSSTTGSFTLGNGWTGWIAGEASRGRVSGTADHFGFRSNGQGGSGGVMYSAGDVRLGAAVHYSTTQNRQDSTGDAGSIGSLRFGAHGAWAPGPFTLAVAASYGRHQVDSTRLVALPSAARASYGADSIGLGAELSTNADLGFAMLTPLAGIAYNSLWTGGFHERGGTFLEIAANSARIAALKPYAGFRLGWDMKLAGGMSLAPELRGRVLYDTLNDKRGFAARFPADPYNYNFRTGGVQPARLSGLVGAGLTLGLAPNASASLNYDAEPRGGAVTHMLGGSLRISW